MQILNSPVEFAHEYLYLSPGARDTVSFGLNDILLTAASDSEDFAPALADALPPSGQEDADFTNLVGSVEQGYTATPVVEDTLASHLSPSLAPSWKSRPLLPTKPCRTTSALIGKSYIAAGQAGMALHTMAILQTYQADVLKEMDEGTGLTPEAVKELRRATDLALRATKHTARAVRSRPLLQWRDPAFLQIGVRMGAIHRRHMITTDASMTGWGAVFEGRPTSGEWTGEFLSWHKNCLDVEPSDGIPDLESVWQSGGGPLCFYRVIQMPALVLPEFPDDSGHRCICSPVAECQSVRVSDNKADSGSTRQSKGEQCPSPSHSPILALPDLVLGTKFPLVSAPLGDSDQTGLAVPASGQDLASSTWALEVVGMAHTRPRAVMNNLPVEVQETIASARAPATRKLYSSKWGVFESWCLARAIDPVNCPVGPVLEFLQERLTAGAADTTLRVYVAAIAARRELDEIPLGRHRMVSAFMRGVRRLRPTRPTAVPSLDLSVVLEGLVTATFEPLESAQERILTLKVTLLLPLTSLKRVGDLQALSVSEMCMDFAPGLVKVTLRPRPGYIPKVLSTSFRSQVVTLHFFHPPPFASSEDEKLHMLCPVRALKLYVDRSKIWRKSSQLLVCFGAGRRGLATSKQRISHWVRDAISLAYEARNLPSPLSLRAHSTRA